MLSCDLARNHSNFIWLFEDFNVLRPCDVGTYISQYIIVSRADAGARCLATDISAVISYSASLIMRRDNFALYVNV